MIKLTEIEIVPVRPNKGLVAFASFILNDSFFIGDVAIYTRIDQPGYRLVYPVRYLVTGLRVHCFKPIHKPVADDIESQVSRCYEKLIENVKKMEGTTHDRLSEVD